MSAFKLSKAQIKQHVELHEELAAAESALESAIEAYNAVLAEAREHCQEIAETAQSEWDEKSERWQESDKGVEAQAWITEWADADLEEVEEPTTHAGLFCDLPECAG